MHLSRELEGFYLGLKDGATSALEMNGMTAITTRGLNSLVMEHEAESSKFVLLILEDFDEIRAFLSRHFEQQGYDVFSSSTLRDALAIVWEEGPHVIIVDYDLKGESPMHAVERLHDARPESYIVLIGGPGTADVEEQAIQVGASIMLSKAYAISEMDQIAESVMNRFFQGDRSYS